MARKAKDLGDGAASNGATKSRMGKVKGEAQDAPPTVVDDGTIEHHHAILSTCMRDVEDATEKARQARGVYQNARKAAKKIGVDCDAWKRAYDLKKRDPAEVIAEHEKTVRYLKIMGAPLGTQFDLLSDVEVRNTISASAAGRAAYKNLESIDNNPHSPGTAEFVDWRGGWNEAMHANTAPLESMGKAPAADPAKAKIHMEYEAEGRIAAGKGIGLEGNPYADTLPAHRCWKEGWEKATSTARAREALATEGEAKVDAPAAEEGEPIPGFLRRGKRPNVAVEGKA